MADTPGTTIEQTVGHGKPGIRMVIKAKDRVGLIADLTKIFKDFDITIRVTFEKDDQKAGVVLMLGN
ncbi:MAG: hypothetical protein PHP51_05835 [Desulfotomaculaceae bacterium]|nr:hypothetical protein [Desulfotomaculaceae bacterium]MDD4765979.1 hypothetical protein [Desulfotomaculaceae bacterium]